MAASVSAPFNATPSTRSRVVRFGVRAVVLVLMVLNIVAKQPGFGSSGQGIAVAVLLVLSSIGWLVWTATGNVPTTHLWMMAGLREQDVTPPPSAVYAAVVMGICGGALTAIVPDTSAVAFPCASTILFAIRFSVGTSAALTATTVVPLVVVSLAVGHPGTIGWLGMIAGLFAIGNSRRSYVQRAVQAEQLLGETRRANAEQANAATLAERTRIAREIHDVLAHSLAALSVQLEAADALLAEGHDPARAHEYVNHAQRIAREGLHETRRAIAALREDAPPLPDLVRTLAKSYEADTGAPADLTVTGVPRPLSPDVALALYRTAQEAFTNVRKHAPGTEVACELAYDDAATELTVRNTLPPGGAAASFGGYGLTGMRERATLLAGTLIAGPYDDEWRVTVRVPYRTGEAL